MREGKNGFPFGDTGAYPLFALPGKYYTVPISTPDLYRVSDSFRISKAGSTPDIGRIYMNT